VSSSNGEKDMLELLSTVPGKKGSFVSSSAGFFVLLTESLPAVVVAEPEDNAAPTLFSAPVALVFG
jgi:hypothetical protein